MSLFGLWEDIMAVEEIEYSHPQKRIVHQHIMST